MQVKHQSIVAAHPKLPASSAQQPKSLQSVKAINTQLTLPLLELHQGTNGVSLRLSDHEQSALLITACQSL